MPETDVDMSATLRHTARSTATGSCTTTRPTSSAAARDGRGSPSRIPTWSTSMSLSPSEQEAYNADLYGDPSIWEGVRRPAVLTDATMVVAPPLDQQGCQGKARLEVVGEDPTSDPAVQQMLNDFYESQQNDPGSRRSSTPGPSASSPSSTSTRIEATLRTVFDGYQIMEGAKYKALGAEIVARRQPGRDGRVLQQRRERAHGVRPTRTAPATWCWRRTASCPSSPATRSTS